jgi:outer membrane protein OmpA-like peptidoglycan-associated protein
MSNSTSNSRGNPDGRHGDVPEKPLETLRSLIVGPTDHRLDDVVQALDNPEQRAKAISGVLPRAVTLGALKDNRLAAALEPIMENAIRASIKKDRRILVDALFPVMGPAIRKAIASTIQGLIQNFNQILEHSVSIRGLRWRLEALRTRRPFAEVVLLNTLVYQVEQVFLIHRDSGLLVEHVVAKSAVAQNPDLVSGMLTAIKDFVQDSFGAAKEDTLETFQVGERKIWIEHGAYAMLAIVMQGNPPAEIREMMRDALDEIHLKQSDALSSFDGDSEAFEACRPILNGMLQVQFKKRQQNSSYRPWIAVAVVVVLIGWMAFLQIADARRWGRFADRLHAQPGIVVTQVIEQDDRRHIYGLKDPYAPDPSALVAPAGLSPESVVFHWEPYQSAYPAFVQRRITTLFNPPSTISLAFEQDALKASGSALHPWIEDTRRLARIVPWIDTYADRQVVDIDARLDKPLTVTLTLDGKTLRAVGSASHTWIARARTESANLPGIEAYDDSLLIDADEQAWKSLSRTIVETVFYFNAGHNQLAAGQDKNLNAFVEAVRQLITLSHRMEKPLRIDIIGHADQTGDETFNLFISRKRAQVVADLLVDSGIDPTFVSVHAAGSGEPATVEAEHANRARDRRVVFKVSHTGN